MTKKIKDLTLWICGFRFADFNYKVLPCWFLLVKNN